MDNFNNISTLIDELNLGVGAYKDNLLEESNACLKPCTEIIVHSLLKSEEWPNMAQIGLKLKRRVKVTRYLMAYRIFDLVVEIGSSLGLWIGLSALGVFDLVLDVSKVFKFIRNTATHED